MWGKTRTVLPRISGEKVTAVSLCLRLQYCQSCQFSQDDGFCGEDDRFCGEDDRFLAKTKDFSLFLHLHQKSFVFTTLFAMCSPHAAMFTLHTNEWSTYTEHVRTYWGNPLYWACAHAALGMCRHNNEGKSTDWHDWQYWRRKHKLTVFTHSSLGNSSRINLLWSTMKHAVNFNFTNWILMTNA